MALSGRKTLQRGPVGLDIDARFLAAVVADGERITQAASTELAPGVIVDGELADAPALTSALKAFFEANDLPKGVRLGVSNQQIIMREIELPPVEDEGDREAAVRFQAAETIPMPIEEVELDYQVMGPVERPDAGPLHKVILVAARTSMVETLAGAVSAAGLKPEGLDLDAFALVRMLTHPAEPTTTARMFCHLAGVTNLAVAVGAMCTFTRPLFIADNDQGERDPSLLADEILRSLDFYMAQPEAKPVRELVLSGPGACQEGLVEELASLLRMPTRVADPLGRIEREGLPGEEDAYRHTVAAGLAIGAEA